MLSAPQGWEADLCLSGCSMGSFSHLGLTDMNLHVEACNSTLKGFLCVEMQP